MTTPGRELVTTPTDIDCYAKDDCKLCHAPTRQGTNFKLFGPGHAASTQSIIAILYKQLATFTSVYHLIKLT